MENQKFIEILKITPDSRLQLRPCADCGDLVKNRVVEFAVYSLGTKNQHWKKCCRECGKKTVVSGPIDRI